MVVQDMITAMVNTIKQNMEIFGENHDLSLLTPENAEAVTKAIDQATSAGAVAGYRAYLESHEVRERSIPVGDEEYRLKGPVEKEYLTPFGPMVLSRNLYQNASDTKSHIPLEATWGMTGEFMTVEVREAVLYSSAFMTPEEIGAQFGKWARFHPSATAVKHVIGGNGRLIAEHKDELDAAVREVERAPEAVRVLCVSMDGTNIRLRETGEKRGRPTERPTGKEAGTTSSVYKNAMVGSVSFYGEVPEGEKTPERLASRYTSHMPEDRARTFKRQFEAEVTAAQSQCGPDVVKVVLLDGARPLWKYVESTPLFDDYETLIDYGHTLEHLSAAAEALFGKDNSVANLWYDTYRQKLLESDRGVESVIRSMGYFAEKQNLRPARQKELKTQQTFFTRNKHRMRYAEFRRRGLPIGSGPVEAACKSLVKTRMCRSGMRWSRQGGEHILDIRTYVKSNRWETAWTLIKSLSRAA